MLGTLDTSDWTLIGSTLAALAAIIKGFRAGETDKKKDPAVPTSQHTFADVELLAQAISLNTAAVAKQTVVLEETLAILKAEAHRHAIEDAAEERATLKFLAEQLKPKGRG